MKWLYSQYVDEISAKPPPPQLKMNLTTILALGVLSLAQFTSSTPLLANVTASTNLATRHPGWDFNFQWNFCKGPCPYYEWWYNREHMMASGAYDYAMETHFEGRISIIIENRDDAWMHINVMNKGFFTMAPQAWAIVGNIPAGGERTLRAYPGCAGPDGPDSCLGYPGLGSPLEWSNIYGEDNAYINLSLGMSSPLSFYEMLTLNS